MPRRHTRSGLNLSAELALERQRAEPLARHREDRVRKRGPGHGRARLADPAGRFIVAHEVHFDRRRLTHPQHPIVVEVGLLDPPILERDLAPQRRADAEIDAALDLCLHDVGVDHGAAVDRADDSVYAHLACVRHLDFGDLRQIAAPLAVEQRHPAAARGALPKSARRYSTGSAFAATASSSTKLSITKMLWVGPTPRQKVVLSTGSSCRTYSI